MNPYKLREVYKYLTRAKKAQPELPDVFPASKAPIPAKTQNVQEIEAVNRFMKANPRKDLAGGGFIKQLYRGIKGLQQGKIEKELINKYRGQGMDLLEAINKANPEANQIVKNRKLKAIQDKLNETNVLTDDYVKLIDEEIKLNDPELFKDIIKFEKNNRSDLVDKMRALRHPDWAEANFGENYQDILQQRQNRAIKQMMDDIDPNVKERTVVDDIDDMNQANIDEFFGRKKNADGGRIGFDDGGMLVQPGFGGVRQGYAKDKKIKGFPNLKVGNRERALVASKAAADKKLGTSTRFSLPELNRVSRIKFGKNFKDLASKKERDRVFSSLVFRQQQKLKGKDVTPITKKTTRSPFPKDKQTKIKNYFPDADFEKYPRFGYSKDSAEYRRILAFVDRGFKPVFKEIPKSVQELIKDKFTNIKNWDFKRYRYGVPPSESGSQQWQRIRTFVSEPKPNLFAFDYRKPGGWMITQMERAWKHGNPDYDIITVDPNKPPSVDNKIIGVKEKGKAYYANENIAPSNKAKLITSHPEFNKVQKFVDIANEAKLPLKDLTGYKNTKALLKLFPEGYESIKLSELVRFAYDIQGVDVTKNAIEKHHLKTLSDLGAPVDSKNLQLLRRDLNVLANTIGNEVKAGNLSRIPELERAGVKITVDGKTYGKGFQDPRRQMNRIIGDVTQKVSSLDKKQFNNLLAKIGCPGKGKAYGGRIQFQDGLSPEVCMTRGAQVIQEKRIDSPSQKANFNKMMKVASVGKNMALLKDVLGPYGLGGDVLLEGMIAVNKTLTGGTPFKESWQDSWLSSIVGGAYDEAGQKLGRQKLFELRSGLSEGAEEFGDYNRKVEEYYKLIDQKNNLDLFQGSGDLADTSQEFKFVDNKIKTAERELGRMETRINAQGGFEAAENEFNRKTAERQDADAATSPQSIGRRFVEDNQLNEMLRNDFSGLSSDALPMQKEPRPVLSTYETFKPDIPTLPQYKDMYEKAGVTPPDDSFLEQDLNQEKFRQLFTQPGFMGASDTFFGDTVKMAGGGIAKLAGIDQGPPPASGPNSQGLLSLKNRVRNY